MVTVRRPRNTFQDEPRANIGRSQFDMSFGIKTTFDASWLIPILVQEILPGDTFTCRLNGFCRIFSPLDAPLMDNIELETFFFFVPNRLVWANWENFMGAHDDAGAQDTDYTIPISNASTFGVDHDAGPGSFGLLGAYFGLPEGLDFDEIDVSLLPFRAYNLIYNEWFRDQNLTDKVTVGTGDGPDGSTPMGNVRPSAKRHDYFTSCVPYLQKGDAVSVALAGLAPVVGIGKDIADETYSVADQGVDESDDVGGSGVIYPFSSVLGTDHADWYIKGTAATGGSPAIFADLTQVSGVSINALRESVAIQRLLEKDARGGTRYVEIIKSHFGVTSPDFRHQRPEFLGGGKGYINISPVANTSDTAGSEQGELRGIGTGVIQGHGWAKSFTEHGYVMGIIRARGDLTYFQGLDRHWSRSTRYDFYMPALANLGEQSVLNKEIFVSNVLLTDNAVFGYQERWSEYRSNKSKITATFNPDITGSLSHWHLAEDFSSLPSLNTAFINDDTPMSRVVTINTEHDFVLDLWFDLKAARPIPVHSIPSLLGSHF